MFFTVLKSSRCFLFALLCFCVTPLMAEDTRKPAVPGERFSDIRINSKVVLMSADGNWVCFRTSAGLGAMNLKTGSVQGLGNRNQYWRVMHSLTPVASWSPVAPELAFRLQRDGKYFLAVWSAGEQEPRRVMSIPKSMFTSISRPPVWSADGKTLYVLINQHLPWPRLHPDDDYPPNRSENATLQMTDHYFTKIDRRRFEKQYEGAYAESTRSLIMAVDVASGRAGMLAKGNDIQGLYLSPDNRQLLAVQIKSQIEGATGWEKQNYGDVYLLKTVPAESLPTIELEEMDDRRAGWFDHRDQRLMPILTDVHMNTTMKELMPERQYYGNNGNPLLSWSPDSKRFAYATVGRQSTGDVFVYDIASARLNNLTADIELQEPPKSLGYGKDYVWPHNSVKFGNIHPPLWLPDGKSLVAVGRGDAWLIPLDSRQKPEMLTGNLPREVRRIIPGYTQNVALMDSDGYVKLIAKERDSRMDSLWRQNVNKPRSEKLADAGVWINPIVATNAAGDKLLYTGQAQETSTNVYQVVQGKGPELVTRYQLQLAERRYPTMRVLTWQTREGETAHGLLYLPDGAAPGKKVPMILHGYPGQFDSRLDDKAKKGIEFFNDILYGMLQEGFAVLYPDLELSNEGVYDRPMWRIVEAVKGATEAALATDLIDENRLGIMGGSYGGYMTQAVITQTDRFKAAVSRSGLSDLYGDYAAGGMFSREWSEYGQGRMVVPPWEDPKRYTDNSPMSYFGNVKTPLLLIHGENDHVVPPELSRQSYRALERLKSPVVYANYRRLYHAPNLEVNRRVRLWFRQHLLGGDNVAGLADQGSFFLGGDLKQDKPVNRVKSTAGQNKAGKSESTGGE